MLSMTENGGIQLFLFLYFVYVGVACSVVEQSQATAKLHKNSEKIAACGLFVCNCLKINHLWMCPEANVAKKSGKVIAVRKKGCIFASALAT